MDNYRIDYIKEKAKANYELIKIFSLLFIAIAVGTISELKTVVLSQEIDHISVVKAVLITGGFVSCRVLRCRNQPAVIKDKRYVMILTGAIIFTIALIGAPTFLLINAVKENREIRKASLKKSQTTEAVARPKAETVNAT